MKKTTPTPLFTLGLLVLATAMATAQDSDDKLRIIAFGAHPDDAEFQAGGTAIMWAQQGHHVKFVSVTNGDIGHWQMAGGPLAQRRTAEVVEAARRMGITTEVLDIHDGELLPTLDNRRTITRLIREWKADIVLSHRPNDYHPDHRNVGILVQDSAFMVTVPFFCPGTPRLTENPVFFFYPDRFKKPYAFQPDVAVSIDAVFEKKLHAIDALESQVYEGGALGTQETLRQRMAHDPVARKEILARSWQRRQGGIANRYREALVRCYGLEEGKKVKYAEAFEICEYGRQPSEGELKQLFPFTE